MCCVPFSYYLVVRLLWELSNDDDDRRIIVVVISRVHLHFTEYNKDLKEGSVLCDVFDGVGMQRWCVSGYVRVCMRI